MKVPPVVIDPDGEATGMAEMVGGLIEANLTDSPARSWAARRVHGSVLLEASDRGLGVTVTFSDGGVTVLARRQDGVVPVMRGPWLLLTQVCSGLTSPLRAFLRRELGVGWSTPLTVLVIAGFILTVPRSVYRASLPVAPRMVSEEAASLAEAPDEVPAISILGAPTGRERNTIR